MKIQAGGNLIGVGDGTSSPSPRAHLGPRIAEKKGSFLLNKLVSKNKIAA